MVSAWAGRIARMTDAIFRERNIPVGPEFHTARADNDPGTSRAVSRHLTMKRMQEGTRVFIGILSRQ